MVEMKKFQIFYPLGLRRLRKPILSLVKKYRKEKK